MEWMVLFGALTGTALFTGWLYRRRVRQSPPPAPDEPEPTAVIEARIAERTAALAAALAEMEEVADGLSRADHARTAFLAGLAHALRGHLHVADGQLQLIRRAAAASGQGLDRGLDDAAQALSALTALTGTIGDFIETDDLLIDRVDPRLAVRDVCDELAETARTKGVEVRCPPPTAGIGVMADARRLRRILRCLLSNAIGFNRPGGAVLVEVRQTGEDVTLFVHDTGPGIAATQLPRLFEPFRRAGHGDHPSQNFGLGLASAHALALSMHGRLTVASQEGQGSTFSLHLPAARPERADGGATPRLPAATLLYLDADPRGMSLMRRVLPSLGPVVVHFATTGAQGLALARALHPDAVVVDPDLSDMDGFEWKARMDADDLTRDIPVIALSAAALASDRRRGRAAGFDAFLTKPVDLDALALALDRVLRTPGRAVPPRPAAA